MADIGHCVRNLTTGFVRDWRLLELPPFDPETEELYACEAAEFTSLFNAKTPLQQALARLITEYDRRRAETVYTVPDGPSVTLLPSTAESLLKMLQIAARLVETGRGSETLWIDDGPTGDVAVTLTAQQIVEHAGAYTDAIAEIEIWAAQKKAEIEASEDPLAVPL